MKPGDHAPIPMIRRRRAFPRPAAFALAAGLAAAVLVPGAALVAPAHAQFGDVPAAETLVQPSARPLALRAGTRGVAEVALTIRPTWHINANPPSSEEMIPTEIKVTGTRSVRVSATRYPKGHEQKLSFSDEALLVYDGTVTVQVPLEAAADAASGAHRLSGVLTFQACNDNVCLPPTDVPFSIEVTVEGGAPATGAGPAVTGGAPDASGDPNAPGEAPSGEPAGVAGKRMTEAPEAGAAPAAPAGAAGAVGERLAQALSQGGLAWFFALFAGGLLLNLTPCVFPMIGVTVSVFGARRKEPPLKVLGAAVAYVLGIAVMYSALGVAAALTGGLFGAALQNPWVNVVLGGLFLVLALSMFGLYEMNPPSWLLEKIGGANTTNVLGIFASGLAVGVIAAPCVGPFVVALLAILAQRGDALFGFQAMFTLALGLGLPYLLLAMFSNLLQSLPRSGDWMLWVKKVFGVLMVAIGLNYVLIGLQPDWAPWVMPVALALGGLYLGFVDGHGNQKRGFRNLKYGLGTLAIVGAVASFMVLRAEGIRFQPYSDAALQAAFASGRPVMMDFSADWCAPCHELDRYTFTDPRVKDLSRRYVAFKVDLTRYNSAEAKALRERYGVTGVPEVLFFRPDGNEVVEARVLGFMPPAPFLERMSFVAGG